MGGHVLIVDRDDGRRAALRAGLHLPADEVAESGEPADLPVRVAERRPDLLLLDLGAPEEPALDALRWIRLRPGDPLPTIALVPSDRPDLRLSALRVGAEDATDRDTPHRMLRARVRSLLRQRDAALEMAPRDEGELAMSGLSEAPAAFAHALFAPATPADRPRVALLSLKRSGASPPLASIADLLEAEVVRLDGALDLSEGDEDGFDLVVIDGAGTRGDLQQGAQVLALLAELLGRLRARRTATLVLLPASAQETAALALDLGASDVVAGPVSPREVALRARALVARQRLRTALRDQVRQGLRAAMTDPLTGLHNRRYAENALRRMGERARLDGRSLSLVVIDIDHFKVINDTHGHAAGDRVLVDVAKRLQAVLRPADLIARVGGEEFLVGLDGTTTEEATAVAERLRAAIADEPFAIEPEAALFSWQPVTDLTAPILPSSRSPGLRHGAGSGATEIRVTVSLGVASISGDGIAGGLTLAELFRRADEALYRAKGSGRDAVAASPETA